MKVHNPNTTPVIYGNGKTIDGLGFAVGKLDDFQSLIESGLLVVKEQPKESKKAKKPRKEISSEILEVAEEVPSVEAISEDTEGIIPTEQIAQNP